MDPEVRKLLKCSAVTIIETAHPVNTAPQGVYGHGHNTEAALGSVHSLNRSQIFDEIITSSLAADRSALHIARKLH